MAKEQPYSRGAYEAAEKKVSEASGAKEKIKAAQELEKLEGKAFEEATRIQKLNKKAQAELKKAQEKVAVLRKEMGLPKEKKIIRTMDEIVASLSPEAEVERFNIEIGGRTKDELIKELELKGIAMGPYVMPLFENDEFIVLAKSENIELIKLTVEDLGFPPGYGATTKMIYEKAEELGLDLCPAEVGPYFRMQYSGGGRREGEEVLIAMEPMLIAPPNLVDVFGLDSTDDEEPRPQLNGYTARPDMDWPSAQSWVFCLRSSLKKTE